MKKNINKTISINGQLIICKTETGQEYVQFLPNNPAVGQVEPFRGVAHAQLLSNGVFDSLTRKRRHRGKPCIKLLGPVCRSRPTGTITSCLKCPAPCDICYTKYYAVTLTK